MRATLALVWLSLGLWTNSAEALGLGPLGPQAINLRRLQSARPTSSRFTVQGESYNLGASDEEEVPDYDLDESVNLPSFKAYWHRQPLDHFDKHNKRTWRQRYWINTRHYKPNTSAPVIVLDGGETSGANRLPFLDTGIVEILAKATGGVGVVLEHRYYGRSMPVSNLSTDSLRWLDNAQSAADSAHFMANVKFEDIDEDLTAPNAPWIYYGGSYAGARAAHMKVLYPDLVFGAISSSGVTHAALTIWEYMDVIRMAMDPVCAVNLQSAIATIDNILGHPAPAGPLLRKTLKKLFGLDGLEHDEDFASILTSPLGSWQSKNWDPEVGSSVFDEFCEALNKPLWGLPAGHERQEYGHNDRLVSSGPLQFDMTILNYAKYIKKHVVSGCPDTMTVEECFGTFDATKYQDISLDQEWRKWLFQVCTEWGYFVTAPPDPDYPRIVSNLLTLEYESKICRQAYPDGDHFVVPPLPNITAVNVLGSFTIAADRLAIIDGEVDPWKPATPHSRYAPDRQDTIERPFKLIPGGVHHYDEFGLADIEEEPAEILKIHKEMIHFVKAWLKDWKTAKVAADTDYPDMECTACCGAGCTMLRPIYSPLQHPLSGLYNSSQIPTLNLTLTPVLDSTTSDILAISSVLAFDIPSLGQDEVLLSMPLIVGNVPSNDYSGNHSIAVADADGLLEVYIQDDENSVRNWLASRDVHGPVVVKFTALPRTVTPQTRMGPRIDLRTDQGGVMGAGINWIPAPVRGQTVHDINIVWNTPETMSSVWTYGQGAAVSRRGPASDIVSTYYGVGPLRDYTSPAHPGFGVYWFGEPTLFNATELGSVVEGLFTRMAGFFEDAGASYRIFIRKSTAPAWGGTAQDWGFMLEWSDATKLASPQEDVYDLLAHEIVHNWTVMQAKEVDGGEEDPGSAWYTEGTAEYYAAVLPFRLGLYRAERLVKEVNKFLSAYYTSPVRSMSDEEAVHLAWHDVHAQRLSYNRGAVYLLFLQGLITESTGGQHSLDDSVLGLVRLRRAGKPFGLEQWLEMLEPDLGARAGELHAEMASGKWLVVPPETALGPGFTRVRIDQYPFDLGMDAESLRLGTVIGVKPGSRAEEAGLRNGDRISSAQSVWMAADVYEGEMEVRVTRDGEDEEWVIKWWPRGWEKVEAWKWHVGA